MAEAESKGDPTEALAKAAYSAIRDKVLEPYGEYASLTEKNKRLAQEYGRLADVASGVSVFVRQLDDKNEQLRLMLGAVEELDGQVSELEAVVATLDTFSTNLEATLLTLPNAS